VNSAKNKLSGLILGTSLTIVALVGSSAWATVPVSFWSKYAFGFMVFGGFLFLILFGALAILIDELSESHRTHRS
jgi:hypothetical protein